MEPWGNIPSADVYVDDDADPSWYDATHVKTIQEGINNATSGDTVFVYNGIYYEHIIINKSLNLNGESSVSTIIDGSGNENIVLLIADHISFQNFSVQNGGYHALPAFWVSSHNNTISHNVITNSSIGLALYDSQNNTITDNRIVNNDMGLGHISSSVDVISNNTFSSIYCDIYVDETTNCTYINNTFLNSTWGMTLYSPSGNTVIRNTFINSGIALITESAFQNTIINNSVNGKPLLFLKQVSNEMIDNPDDAGQIILYNCTNITIKNQELVRTPVGIQIWRTNNCSITNNFIFNNSFGILLDSSQENIITNNTVCENTIISIIANGYGIALERNSDENIITRNTVSNNLFGIALQESIDNQLYHNSIINNTQYNAYDDSNNSWDNGYPSGGNYWSDYIGSDLYQGTGQNISGSDGVGDIPYDLPGKTPPNQDRYPLLHPFVLGDLNVDGSVNFGDINPFVLALCDPLEYQSTYHILPSLHGDINQDGSLNFGDINPFVWLLTNG